MMAVLSNPRIEKECGFVTQLSVLEQRGGLPFHTINLTSGGRSGLRLPR